MTPRILQIVVILAFTCVSKAAAAPVVWTYEGLVDGHDTLYDDFCQSDGYCPLEDAVPLGSIVQLRVFIDPLTPEDPECVGYYPGASSKIVLKLTM